jgi:hypothetical protein
MTMGFTVSVEANNRSGVLSNGGGNAVLAFLSALDWYVKFGKEPDKDFRLWYDWFKHFETKFDQPLGELFEPIVGCMWADGGDHTQYSEAEYEWFCKRNPYISKEQFKILLKQNKERWSDIDAVMTEVKILIEAFKRGDLLPADGCYDTEYTLPDFEDVYEVLKVFKQFGYDTVRLNFS